MSESYYGPDTETRLRRVRCRTCQLRDVTATTAKHLALGHDVVAIGGRYP